MAVFLVGLFIGAALGVTLVLFLAWLASLEDKKWDYDEGYYNPRPTYEAPPAPPSPPKSPNPYRRYM